jgi:hypothetical protein
MLPLLNTSYISCRINCTVFALPHGDFVWLLQTTADRRRFTGDPGNRITTDSIIGISSSTRSRGAASRKCSTCPFFFLQKFQQIPVAKRRRYAMKLPYYRKIQCHCHVETRLVRVSAGRRGTMNGKHLIFRLNFPPNFCLNYLRVLGLGFRV